ncbi:MAG: NirD/YgiW/YdeI family stress tolerance protein [Alphaproteobacteria bacterium]|nr:NirD/YgiW/YdeI family stress tolerance protein [Alphaproteobacteria bacterium]MBO7641919.1 NirD/YgiW/YdeI family stress tolerance protein [Alphaproteobacteria bacterium]
MKRTLFIFVFGMLTSGLAFGDFVSTTNVQVKQGGFKGSGVDSAIKTVSQVKDEQDDAWVTVKGNIVKKLSKDKYLFKDSTGEIVVEIDSKYWQGVEVNEKDVVELSGEVDKDYFEDGKFTKIKLDVKSPVQKVQ